MAGCWQAGQEQLSGFRAGVEDIVKALREMEKTASEQRGAPEQLEEALQQMARLGGQYVDSVKGLLANQMEQVQQQREDNKKVLQ